MSAAVVSCGALAFDVRAIARRRGWDVEVVPVDALLHNHPDRIAPAVAKLRERNDVVAVAYADCGSPARSTRSVCRGWPVTIATTCSRAKRSRRALEEEPGTYFLTDFLARTFEHTVVRELGLDRHPELRDEYFRHYTRVMWLAQRPTPRDARVRGGRRGTARAAARDARGRHR